MLILEAEIYFDTYDKNPNALTRDPSTNGPIRPAINFGNDILFSGTLIPDKKETFLLRGKPYHLFIEMPTVEHEAFEEIREHVIRGGLIKLQNASRVIGKGKIIDFVYE